MNAAIEHGFLGLDPDGAISIRRGGAPDQPGYSCHDCWPENYQLCALPTRRKPPLARPSASPRAGPTMNCARNRRSKERYATEMRRRADPLLAALNFLGPRREFGMPCFKRLLLAAALQLSVNGRISPAQCSYCIGRLARRVGR
jgi:hypothetical protein